MANEVKPHLMKNLRLNNFSIHINLHQNRFVNECARKILPIKWPYLIFNEL